MIKPDALLALCKSCDNSKWLGDICRRLGGQNIKLDAMQKIAYDIIKGVQEIEEEEREKYNKHKRERNSRKKVADD